MKRIIAAAVGIGMLFGYYGFCRQHNTKSWR